MLTTKTTLRVVRKICRLTQAELAHLLGCSRLTVHGLEAKKLKLSQKMAERIALHTGVSQAWLLTNDDYAQPCCQRDVNQHFTREVFDMIRAEISHSRTKPGDLFLVSKTVEGFCSELRACAGAACRVDERIYFYYKVRQFLDELARRWKPSGSGISREEFLPSLEKDAKDTMAKETSDTSRGGRCVGPTPEHKGRTKR